jgi:hypothetical protein
MTILEKNQSLYTVSRNYFGSYRKAVKAAGFDYKTIRVKP